jgi:poly-gamma-glutamate synthesis protein (capsule biosynthesis protein)
MFDRGVRNIIENRGRDPFEYMKKDVGALKPYDEFIVNLEGPIVTMPRTDCQQKAYNFQFASDTPARLKAAGITMVNIANNHAFDCYAKGFESTKNSLSVAGIPYIGDDEYSKSYVEKTIRGKKFAFIGMDETVQAIPLSGFYGTVKELAARNDYVVVDIHWGTEYELGRTDAQEAIAHALIDSGASIIFGHHPHVVEPLEIYEGKPIFYSLGNFVFDQTGEDETRGLGVGAELRDEGMRFTLLPFDIKTFAPDFLSGDTKAAFCEKFLAGVAHAGCSFEI